MTKKFATTSHQSMDQLQNVRTTMVLSSLIPKNSALRLKISSLNPGVFSKKNPVHLTTIRLHHLLILGVPKNTLSTATQIQQNMLQNMCQAIWIYRKCYKNAVQSRSIFNLKTLLSVNSKLAEKKHSHLSTKELLDKIEQYLQKMELKQRLIFEYPKIHYIPCSASVTDLTSYLLIQNITLITSILNTSESGKNI